MASVTFSVDGKVMGKGRPRFTRGGRPYTPKSTREYEKAVRDAYLNAPERPPEPFSGPVAVSVVTCRQLPKSTPQRVRREPDTHKPDADNVAKVVMDALNGVAWLDDAQVTTLCVRKCDRMRYPETMFVTIVEEERDDVGD